MPRTVFTIWEGWASLYLSDESDTIGPEVFIGACFERIDCSRQYAVRQRPFLGRPHQRNYNEDEQHTVELRNALQVSGGGEIKSLDRFARHVLVVVWHDEEKRVWLKRTYLGVTEAAEAVGGEAAIDSATTLRAERMLQSPGSVTWPTMAPDTVAGRVDWVKGGVRVPLYRYDGAAVFTALDTQSDALGKIIEDGSGVEFYVEGTLAMRAALGGGLVVNALVATGGSFYDTALAKLEFLTAGVRVATLARDGTLAVPRGLNAGAAPGTATDLELRPGGTWAASLGLGRTAALSFSDTLP